MCNEFSRSKLYQKKILGILDIYTAAETYEIGILKFNLTDFLKTSCK